MVVVNMGFKDKSVITNLVDTFLNGETDNKHPAAIREMADTVDKTRTELAKIRSNGGRDVNEKLQATLVAAGKKVVQHGPKLDALEEGMVSIRGKAINSFQFDGAKPIERDTSLEREIRDDLKRMTTLERNARYLAACDSKDVHLCRAVENAPQSFPLVDRETLERGQESKIENSPFKAALRAAHEQRDAFKVIFSTAKRELVDMGARGLTPIKFL